MALEHADVLRAAHLARLGLDEGEADRYLDDLGRILEMVDQLQSLDTDGVAPLAALISAFPGGSITGAPKKRAMQIIQELEPAPRGAYCGSLFWQDDQGRFDSNILIRTLQTDGDRLHCHGGGGIVFDSDPDEEYAESWFKVRKLMGSVDS